MSRTTRCLGTAAALVVGSVALIVARAHYQAQPLPDLQAVAPARTLTHDPPPGPGQRFFRIASLDALPAAERQLVEVLLLLPIAALVICVFRNVIGLSSFGTFTPALLGLAFRDLRSWPGVIVFVSLLLAGWLLRRGLDRFRLLQVPRISLMLSLVIVMLVSFMVVSHHLDWPATRYIALFPLIVLTGMIERFMTMEEEDGARASFRTLASTLVIAAAVSLVISRATVTRQVMSYPESLGLVMAGQLLLGRYTGYRLVEWYRFREFLRRPLSEPMAPGWVASFDGR